MQEVMANDHAHAHQVEVLRSARVVRFWVTAVPLRNELVKIYESFADNYAEYCKHLNGETNWQRLVASLLSTLKERKEQFKISTATETVQTRLKVILAQVQQWQDGDFPVTHLETSIK